MALEYESVKEKIKETVLSVYNKFSNISQGNFYTFEELLNRTTYAVIKDFNNFSSIQTFAHGCASNIMKDFNKNISSIKKKGGLGKGDENFDGIIVLKKEDPEKKLIEKDIIELIIKKIEQLEPEKLKYIFWLYFYYDLSEKEVSKKTGINLNTIKSDIRKIRIELKRWVGDFDIFIED